MFFSSFNILWFFFNVTCVKEKTELNSAIFLLWLLFFVNIIGSCPRQCKRTSQTYSWRKGETWNRRSRRSQRTSRYRKSHATVAPGGFTRFNLTMHKINSKTHTHNRKQIQKIIRGGLSWYFISSSFSQSQVWSKIYSSTRCVNFFFVLQYFMILF